jgi:hypothetical protein
VTMTMTPTPMKNVLVKALTIATVNALLYFF